MAGSPSQFGASRPSDWTITVITPPEGLYIQRQAEATATVVMVNGTKKIARNTTEPRSPSPSRSSARPSPTAVGTVR